MTTWNWMQTLQSRFTFQSSTNSTNSHSKTNTITKFDLSDNPVCPTFIRAFLTCHYQRLFQTSKMTILLSQFRQKSLLSDWLTTSLFISPLVDSHSHSTMDLDQACTSYTCLALLGFLAVQRSAILVAFSRSVIIQTQHNLVRQPSKPPQDLQYSDVTPAITCKLIICMWRRIHECRLTSHTAACGGPAAMPSRLYSKGFGTLLKPFSPLFGTEHVRFTIKRC